MYQWQGRALLPFRGEKIGAQCYGDSGKGPEVGGDKEPEALPGMEDTTDLDK